MQPEVEARFEQLEERRESLQARFRRLDDHQLRFRPTPESWTLLQVAEHLLLSEQYGLLYMQKKIPHLEKGDRPGVRSRVMFPMLRALLALPVRLRMPGPVVDKVAPGEEMTLEQLEERWGRLRAEWRELLDGLSAELAVAPVLRHPIAGRLNAEEGVRFYVVHFDHHLMQVERLLDHPDFPSR